MEPVPQNVRLVRRAYWLIKLRWIAITGVLMAIFLAGKLFNVSLYTQALYIITLLLAIYNLTVYALLNHFTSSNHQAGRPAVKRIINFQMSADLIFLTLLLHFSGGIVNPFIIYYIFHMILASILLSVLESYLQATLGTVLLTLMALLEYKGLVAHYYLEGFAPFDAHADGVYVFANVGVLASTFYLVVFMTSSIAAQSRNQEEGYRLANIQLNEKDRVKDEYVARVTHDIKGHLAAIQSCLGVVDSGITGELNEKQSDFIGRAHRRTNKLSYFVRALLKLTQLRLTNKVGTQPFLISETLENSLAAVEVRAKDKSIILEKKSDRSLGEMIGSSLSVEELITNLLLNAIKYTPAGGNVSIIAKDAGKFVKFIIKDSGIGIPDDEIGHIFDEFYRASNAVKSEKDGTGMGLAIAKQIINRHGGEISVKSKLNEGTTFTFTLARQNPSHYTANSTPPIAQTQKAPMKQ